jgi:hypothetical protein
MTPLRAIVVVALLAPLSAGCGAAEETPGAAGEAEAEVPALTRDEIREHAEAMSPEVAESLGIVDTTIRIESPMPADSVRTAPFVPDSAPSG